MITAILLLVAAAALSRDWLIEKYKSAAESESLKKIDPKHVLAAGLIAAAAISWASSGRQADVPTPAPGPDPTARIVLKGKFVGPDAAADAAVTSALLDELAAEIEWDGMQPDSNRVIRSGQHVDQLRIRARELRCRGVSLGEKHPRARDEIKTFLDSAAGTSGGPLSGEQRSAWVSAYREIARAAADAAR